MRITHLSLQWALEMPRIGEAPMAANVDVVIAFGLIVFALICVVAEGFYFLLG